MVWGGGKHLTNLHSDLPRSIFRSALIKTNGDHLFNLPLWRYFHHQAWLSVETKEKIVVRELNDSYVCINTQPVAESMTVCLTVTRCHLRGISVA